VLPIALQALGREALHASAVDTRQGVVAFCAEAETGKSTIAYGLSRLGFEQWSDDVIVFERFAGMLRVLPLPFRPRLRPASRRLFGAAKTESDGVRAAGSARRLAALCVLKRSDHVWAGDGQMIRLAPSRAFSALLGHAVCFDPHDTPRIRQTLERYLDLASTTPVFELQFRHDIDAVPALLARIVTTIEGLGVE
jgi:hypothetical protein